MINILKNFFQLKVGLDKFYFLQFTDWHKTRYPASSEEHGTGQYPVWIKVAEHSFAGSQR